MKIKQNLLSINSYSRPGKKLKEVKAIVIHWTANPNAGAKANRDFFENKKTGTGGYASAHYIIGQNGEIIQCIPDDEVAYHCGTSKIDPESKKVYTDYARKKFGFYATSYKTTSPNWCTIGIELCPINYGGDFTDETIKSAIELCAILLKQFNLSVEDITTHHNIVGWKDCPRLWTKKPFLFEAFKQSVADVLKGESENE